MQEFVEIYWRSSAPSSLSTLSKGANEFAVIYLCRRFAQVPVQALDALETVEIYSRLRPDDKQFAVFEQLPRSI